MFKDAINVPHVKSECMTSNPAFYIIFFECCISIEFFDQRVTHLGEIIKELFLAFFFKIDRDEGFLVVSKVHKSLLNEWSLFKVMRVSLIVLRGAKHAIVHVFPLVTTLSSGFSWSHLQNRAVNSIKQSTIVGNKLD